MESGEFAGLFITWILGVGQARDGAALGWTDASPKRNHRISSTKEEERRGEKEKRRRRRRKQTATEGGRAEMCRGGFRRAVKVEELPHKQHNAETKELNIRKINIEDINIHK